jgi:hypothetical protein
VSYDDEPLTFENLPEDQRQFLVYYEEMHGMLVHALDREGYDHFTGLLSKLLAQANRWGYERAKKEN